MEEGRGLRDGTTGESSLSSQAAVQRCQAVCILLVASVTAVASHKDVGVYEYVVRIEFECLLRHRSEYEIGELGLLLFREFIHLACHPDTEQEVNEFLTLESVLL